jgi:nitrate reductase NapAB chaperone NapD
MGCTEKDTSVEVEEEVEKLKFIIKDRKPKKGIELIEIAEKIKELKDRLGTGELAKRLEVSRSIISDFDRIARRVGSDSELKDLISRSNLGLKAVRKVLTLKDKDKVVEILKESAKVGFSESEIEKIVSCCKKGEPVEQCINQVLKAKPRPTYSLVLRQLPDDVINKVKMNIDIVKNEIQTFMGVDVDSLMVKNGRIVLVLKSEAYRKLLEKAAFSNISEFELIEETLKKVLKFS